MKKIIIYLIYFCYSIQLYIVNKVSCFMDLYYFVEYFEKEFLFRHLIISLKYFPIILVKKSRGYVYTLFKSKYTTEPYNYLNILPNFIIVRLLVVATSPP